jgi:hypothetical protein
MQQPYPGIPPWHLWGSDATVAFNTLGGGNQSTQQLSRVDYHRPETLRFFFWLAILDSSQASGPGWQAVAQFDVNFGVGRSNVQVPDFVDLVLTGNVGDTPFGWSSMAPTRGLSLGPPAFTAAQAFTELVVAEQLNVSCRVGVNAAAGKIVCQVASFFAPNVHLRPEWYERIARAFKGGRR